MPSTPPSTPARSAATRPIREPGHLAHLIAETSFPSPAGEQLFPARLRLPSELGGTPAPPASSSRPTASLRERNLRGPADDPVADALDAGQPPWPAAKFISWVDLLTHISGGREASLTPRSQGNGNRTNDDCHGANNHHPLHRLHHRRRLRNHRRDHHGGASHRTESRADSASSRPSHPNRSVAQRRIRPHSGHRTRGLRPIRARAGHLRERFRRSGACTATPSEAVSAGSNPAGGTGQRHKFEHCDNLG